MKKKFAFLFYLFICINANAQNILLKITTVDSVDINKIIAVKTSFSSKPTCTNYVNQLPNILKAKGYITASIDSIFETQNTVELKLFIGNKYVFKSLAIPSEIKNILGVENDFETLPQAILNYYENNGYPFATIGFDSVFINNKNEITAALNINKGIEYKLDSIRVWGNLSISNNFLQHHLKLAKNSLYNKEKLEKINNRINQLPYLNSYKNWDILMLNKGYILNLYLQPKKVNRFDAIVGFLPNNNQKNGKLLFTLDANINLLNAFAKGETINLSWQQIQPQSPRIDIGFSLPYIFNSSTQLNAHFNLYKRDSAYLNITTDIGAEYELTEKSRFKIFVSNFSTRLIDADTATIIATKKLPAFLDLNIGNLGVEYLYNNTIGTKLNKRKGFEIKFLASFGQKKIKPNTTIASLKSGGFNYNSLYDTVTSNSYQIKTKIDAAKYIAIGKQTVLKLAANYGLIQTTNYVQNELFQIGGFKLLRGFDEENIFTNEYVIGSTEYRYLISNNSYFFAFSDGGFSKNKITKKDYSYIGAGLGLALETKQGILNISFAAGKRNDQPFNIRKTKIHIGIINNF